VSKDIRIIVHRTSGSQLLCYADHHDEATGGPSGGESRRIGRAPRSSGIRETVKEISVPKYVEVKQPSGGEGNLLADLDDDRLLAGVPPEWLADVKVRPKIRCSNWRITTGRSGRGFRAGDRRNASRSGAAAGLDPFVISMRSAFAPCDGQELQRALDYPWEKWTVFASCPEQLVRTAFNGRRGCPAGRYR
jgi:hypothetical protein